MAPMEKQSPGTTHMNQNQAPYPGIILSLLSALRESFQYLPE